MLLSHQSGRTRPRRRSSRAKWLPSPIDPERRIRAVLFDLDGTLYRQPPLRALMALELVASSLWSPNETTRRWRAIRAYRDAQEHLRLTGSLGDLAPAQLARAAEASGLAPRDLEPLVDEWMVRRPLKYLAWCRARGLTRLLAVLDEAGVKVGVFSDYPASGKLGALGVSDRFWPVLSATDPEISALKPHPRGFLRACRLWGFDPSEVLMVGDRVDADAAGAAAASMPCVVIGRRTRNPRLPNVIVLPSLVRLAHVLNAHR